MLVSAHTCMVLLQLEGVNILWCLQLHCLDDPVGAIQGEPTGLLGTVSDGLLSLPTPTRLGQCSPLATTVHESAHRTS